MFEKLRDLIIALDLPPGTVSRAELAERFELSQTPIRDALMRLGEEGLVDIFPQHATLVSRINMDAARQGHFLRRSLELEVAGELASRPSAGLVARLRGYIDLQETMLKARQYGDFVAADQAFHRHMYEAAGVPDLGALVRSLSGHLDRLRRLHLPDAGKAQAVVRDHRRIVDAIAKGDPGAARDRVRKHLSGTLSQAGAIRERYPDFFSD